MSTDCETKEIQNRKVLAGRQQWKNIHSSQLKNDICEQFAVKFSEFVSLFFGYHLPQLSVQYYGGNEYYFQFLGAFNFLAEICAHFQLETDVIVGSSVALFDNEAAYPLVSFSS